MLSASPTTEPNAEEARVQPHGNASRSGPEKRRLRVAVLLDSLTQPLWRRRVLEDVAALDCCELSLVIKLPATSGPKGLPGLVRGASALCYAGYKMLDDFLFTAAPDALEPVAADDILAACPVVNVSGHGRPAEDPFSIEEIEQIQRRDLDVAIYFGTAPFRGQSLQIARHGVWAYSYGDSPAGSAADPGFREVLQGRSVTGAALRVLTDDGFGPTLCRSNGSTEPRSAKYNRNNLHWKSSVLVARKLADLYERGPEALHDTEDRIYAPRAMGPCGVPGNFEMMSLFGSFLARFAAAKINRLLYWDQWILGYRVDTGSSYPDPNFGGYRPLIPPADRLWADPFPVRSGDKWFVFIEEYPYRARKGHISVMEIGPDGTPSTPAPVLERAYHLSYPCVFQFEGAWYMLPETGANRTVELYRSARFPHQWTLDRILMRDVRVADATIVPHAGLWWMFANVAHSRAADSYDELSLFHSKSPLGPWSPHRLNPIKSDVRSARPAGRVFTYKDGLYRPAQDCARRYGNAIAINRILRWDTERYEEVQVSRISPTWTRGLVGTHTLNSCDGLSVIDGLLRRRRVG
jgi:hypothetical protein